MVIQHNMPALNSQNRLKKNNSRLSKSAEKLSSGYAINRAGDDAAGLAVSEKMRSQIRGIKQAVRNSQDGISLIQTFEGALGESMSIIHRLKELAAESSNGTYDDPTDRTAIELEFKQLCSEINQIADTDYNGLCMLNGGRMADGFTCLTENGTMWLTPSEISFPEDGFTSTFKKKEGFPEIEMTIDILPEIKNKIISDMDFMEALSQLNTLSVRSFYNNGVPEFSLIGLRDKEMISIETQGTSGIISITTPKSGKVPVAVVQTTELPHYASSTGQGSWYVSSTATGSYTQPAASTPGNSAFNLEKYKETYVDSDNATKAERQAYLEWIKATNATATLVNDTEFNKDTDPIEFVWSIDGQTYQNALGSNGIPESTTSNHLPVYSDTSKGPQIFFDNLHFYYNDEDFKPTGNVSLSLSWSNANSSITTTVNGRPVMAGNPSMSSPFYLNTWLNHGDEVITLTYNRAQDKWYDNLGGPTDLHDASYYGIDDRYYYSTHSYESRNLYHFYESDGKLKDGFTLKVSVVTPQYRTISSSGLRYVQSRTNDDFCLGELDPANPSAGGIDYQVAKHGAKYTYDGLIQPDGTYGTWRNENGDAVNLVDEGIYLPTNLSSYYTLPLHDGMTITVSNPTMVGEDYIQARILAFDPNYDTNSYKRVYDNITYSENLILQTNSRSKDAINFTFNYNSQGMGDLANDLDCTTKGLGMDKLTLSTQEEANFAIDKLDNALNKVSMVRSTFGAAQNRLEHKIANLNNTMENLTSSESTIRDTDMAMEMMEYTKEQILSQCSQAMLTQANSLPQEVLSLLQ